METLQVNQTPVRTSRNFQINHATLENIEIPETIEKFQSVAIKNDNTKLTIQNQNNKQDLRFGLGDLFTKQVSEKANQIYQLSIDSKVNKETTIEFSFNHENRTLVDNIEIIANEGSKATVIIKYISDNALEYYHNGILKVIAKKDANIHIIIVNLFNTKSQHFMSIDNVLEENSKINYTMIDFGGKNSLTNYYTNLVGDNAQGILNTIYLGKEKQFFDLNYIAELRGKKSDMQIEVQGALKDNAKKHFKGTLDFKKGAKKSSGNENEFCMLLSDTAKSIALPMLLCSEEEVEGNHSSATGKIGEKELFYIMTRGFTFQEAMKLMVRAKFNKILEDVKNETLKNEIIDEIDRRLD